MAVREFNGTSDFIDFGLPANITGAFSILAVVKRLAADASWSSVYSQVNSGGTSQVTYEIEGSTSGTQGGQSIDTAAGGFSQQTTNNVLAADGWCIIAVTKAAGSATARFHVSKNGAAFTHTNGNAITANPGTQAGGKATVGRFLAPAAGDFAHLRLAAIYVWAGTALTDGNVDGLLAKTKTDFLALSPTAGWEFNQASTGTAVPDLVGSANQSAISGTTVVTGDDPPSGVYTLSSGSVGATVTAVPALSLGDSPAPVVSASGDATVSAVPALSAGDSAVPTVSAGSTVTAAVALSLGDAPPVNSAISSEVVAAVALSAGSAPAPVVSSSSGSTVTAVPALSLGDSPAPGVLADVFVTAVAATSAGDVPAPTFGAGSNVTAVPALSAGDVAIPTISPAPATTGVTSIAALFAEDSP